MRTARLAKLGARAAEEHLQEILPYGFLAGATPAAPRGHLRRLADAGTAATLAPLVPLEGAIGAQELLEDESSQSAPSQLVSQLESAPMKPNFELASVGPQRRRPFVSDGV